MKFGVLQFFSWTERRIKLEEVYNPLRLTEEVTPLSLQTLESLVSFTGKVLPRFQ